MVEFFVNILFDIFPQHLVFAFFLQLQLVFDVPIRGKHSDVNRRVLFHSLGNHFVLEVKRLNWSRDKVITTYQNLFVLLILFVTFADSSVFLVVRGRREEECKNCGSFLEKDTHIFLEVLGGEFFAVFLFGFLLLLPHFGF